MGRTIMIMGHYGSGKTEISVNLALKLKKTEKKTALIDVDIANPYFRSRERQSFLEERGVETFFNSYGYDIAEDLPAITAKVRAPLENPEYTTVVDVGGNDSGARIINQFHKYFEPETTERYLVVNTNRYETDGVDGIMFHLRAIENEIKLPINGLINNTHMLAETTVEDVIKGHTICEELSEKTGIPIVWDICNERLVEELSQTAENFDQYHIFPISLQMRPTWLDVIF